jgi:hypothetical protein
MYVRGYLHGSENGRVVTIASQGNPFGHVTSGEKAPLGRILRNFRLRLRAPFQGKHFGVT